MDILTHQCWNTLTLRPFAMTYHGIASLAVAAVQSLHKDGHTSGATGDGPTGEQNSTTLGASAGVGAESGWSLGAASAAVSSHTTSILGTDAAASGVSAISPVSMTPSHSEQGSESKSNQGFEHTTKHYYFFRTTFICLFVYGHILFKQLLYFTQSLGDMFSLHRLPLDR